MASNKPNIKSSSFSKQLSLLIWKNFKLQTRSKIGTFLEFVVPAIFAIILLPIRTIVDSDLYANDTVYEPFNVSNLPPPANPELPLPRLIGFSPNDSKVIQIMEKVAADLNLTKHRKFFSKLGFFITDYHFIKVSS